MKTKRSTLMVVVAFLLCASLAVSASAATLSASAPAGIYVFIRGTISPVSGSSFLPTTTTIKLNPDNAYLKVDVEVKDGVNDLATSTASSTRGVTSFSRSMPLYNDTAHNNLYVFVAHNVQGGAQSEWGYVCNTEGPLT